MKRIEKLKNNLSKRFTAVVCVVALLFNACLIQSFAGEGDTDYTTLTFTDFTNFEEKMTFGGEASNVGFRNAQLSGGLDKCEIEGFYNFGAGTAENRIYFGCGTWNWNAFYIENANAESIRFGWSHSGGGTMTSDLANHTLTPAIYNANNGSGADLARLIGQNLKIKVAFSYADATAATSTLTITITINDIYTTTVTVADAPQLARNIGVWCKANSALFTIYTREELGYTNVTLTDFGFNDVVYGDGNTISLPNAAAIQQVKKQISASLHNYTYEGFFNFSEGSNNNRVWFGPGTWNWNGFAIRNMGNGSLGFWANGVSGTLNSGLTNDILTPAIYNANNGDSEDVTSLTGQDLKIKLSFAFDDPTSTDTTLHVSVTINDVYTNAMTVTHINATKMVGSLCVQSTVVGYPITAKAIIPVSEELAEITPFDFGIENKEIADTVTGVYTSATNLDKTRFATDITLPAKGSGATITFGATDANGAGGVKLSVAGTADNFDIKLTDNSDAIDYQAEISASTIDLDALLGTKVALGIATEFIDVDGDDAEDDVLLVLYINGKQYDNRVFVLKDYVQYFGNYICFQGADADNAILLDFAIPEKPELTEVSLIDDMGMPYGAYEGTGLILNDSYSNGFMNTSVSQKVEFGSVVGSYLNFAGKNNAWLGIRLAVGTNGTLILKAADGEFQGEYTLDPNIAGETLVGAPVDFKLELYQYGAYVKLGVYFNGNLYNNEEFTLQGATADKFGGSIGYYVPKDATENTYFKLVGENPELTEITNRYVNVNDGEYTSGEETSLFLQGKYADSFVGTVYKHMVKFSDTAGMWINYAGKDNAWYGIRFTTNANGTISFASTVGEFTTKGTLTDDIAGVDLVGGDEAYELAIELIPSGENVKMGIYFNGVLYSNKYFILDGAADTLGTNLSYYIPKASGGVITIGTPEAAPVPNENFAKITFNDYDIETGTYKRSDSGFTYGNCGYTSLDCTIFSDMVNFSDVAGSELRIGGVKTGWEGLVFKNIGDGKLQLTAATEPGIGTLVFDSETAGVNLTGEEFELKLSFEFVDYEGDGDKDDVKMGVWFNGKPYGDRWVYLRDKAKDLGGYLGIYLPELEEGETWFSLYTYMPPIDFTEYGFTQERWAIELGLREQ